MNKKCGHAVIGYGGMGGWHTQKVQTMDEIEFYGVYDILPERNKAAEEKGMHSYATLEDLLADERIEFVTIAIPNDGHKAMVIRALEAGKNVICEKPVTMTSKDLQDMIDTAVRCKKVFSVHQNRRWDEDYLVAKKLYDENTLGKVFNIESRVHGSRGIPGDWRNKKAQGGGMILDWGVHLLDQICMMTKSDITSVYCITSNVTNEECDDGFKVILKFADGLTAQVEVGTSNFINLPRWYIQGENGTAVIEDWGINGKITMVSDWKKRDAVPVVTAAGLTKTMAPRTSETIKEFPLPRIESDVRDYYRNFIKAIRGEETQIVTHKQMQRVVKLMEALFKSDETGEAIKEII